MTVSEFLKFLLSQKRQKGNRNSWGARDSKQVGKTWKSL